MTGMEIMTECSRNANCKECSVPKDLCFALTGDLPITPAEILKRIKNNYTTKRREKPDDRI